MLCSHEFSNVILAERIDGINQKFFEQFFFLDERLAIVLFDANFDKIDKFHKFDKSHPLIDFRVWHLHMNLF